MVSMKLLFRFFFLMIRRPPRSTLFPSRRSSDLHVQVAVERALPAREGEERHRRRDRHVEDRKSTRLNSSHQIISYAVFCLKKKKKKKKELKNKKTKKKK